VYATDAQATQVQLAREDRKLAELSVTLSLLNPDLQSLHPAYAQVSISDLPEVRGVETIRVEISPQTPGMRYWAFVSVTNNETQHVTNIAPH
jgi:hypothetical protein